jgi:hypothetical protein
MDSRPSIEQLLFAMLAVDLEYATAEEIAGIPGVAEAATANELGGCLVKAGVLTDEERKLVDLGVQRALNNAVSTLAEPPAARSARSRPPSSSPCSSSTRPPRRCPSPRRSRASPRSATAAMTCAASTAAAARRG